MKRPYRLQLGSFSWQLFDEHPAGIKEYQIVENNITFAAVFILNIKNAIFPKLLVKNVLCSNKYKKTKPKRNPNILISQMSLNTYCYLKKFHNEQSLRKKITHRSVPDPSFFARFEGVTENITHLSNRGIN